MSLESDQYEQAYLLSDVQLLLLLSALDSQPVVGLPLPDAQTVTQETLKQALRVLTEEDWLVWEGEQFRLNPDRAALLRGMKQAPHVLFFLFRGEDLPARSLYLDTPPVAVELSHAREYRVHSLQQGEVLDWITQAESFPSHPLYEREAALLRAESQCLGEQMAQMEAKIPRLEEPPMACLDFPEVQAVLELHTAQEAGAKKRWVWAELPISSVIVEQTAQGSTVSLDTVERREEIISICQAGEQV